MLYKFPVPLRLLIWIIVGQGRIAPVVGAGGVDSLFFLPLSGSRPDMTETLSKKAVKPKSTKPPTSN